MPTVLISGDTEFLDSRSYKIAGNTALKKHHCCVLGAKLFKPKKKDLTQTQIVVAERMTWGTKRKTKIYEGFVKKAH